MIARAAVLSLVVATQAAAEGLSLNELTAQIDADSAEIEGFRALLSDPDPSRAIAAMRAMLLSGDPFLKALALEAGLSSTNGTMRKTALETYLDTGPTLQVTAELMEAETADLGKFRSWMSNYASLSGAQTAVIPLTVGPRLKDQNCYGTGTACSVWPTVDGLTFTVSGVTGALRLAADGNLVGTMGKAAIGGPVALSVDLLGVVDPQ